MKLSRAKLSSSEIELRGEMRGEGGKRRGLGCIQNENPHIGEWWEIKKRIRNETYPKKCTTEFRKRFQKRIRDEISKKILQQYSHNKMSQKNSESEEDSTTEFIF